MQDSLIFSQSSIFYLQKLAHDVHTNTGVRHKLSNENSMLQLLKIATLSTDFTVRHDLERFTDELDSTQVKMLKGQGVILKHYTSSVM